MPTEGNFNVGRGTPGFDAATLAWVAAVVSNGGTVSAAQENYIDALIKGLKADGLFGSPIDRMWMFALEPGSINEPSALTDIIALTLATNVNSTPLTSGGYTGNGTTMFIDSNVDPSLGGVNYVLNSACIGGWSNTAGETAPGAICGQTTAASYLYVSLSADSNCYSEINSTNPIAGSNTGGPTGLYVSNRSDANSQTIDLNGAQIASSGAVPSTGLSSANMSALVGSAVYSIRQVGCFFFGGSLSAADRINIYPHIRTYMTAVGVP